MTPAEGTLTGVQLTRDTIVTAAVEILDTYGLNDMSMRRVATHLSVAPGALYWHVANKQELIQAIAAQILEPVTAHAAPNARDYCRHLRERLLAHRDGAELISSALAQPESLLRPKIEEHLTAALVDESVSPAVAGTAARALVHLLLGASVQQQMREQFAATLTSARGEVLREGAPEADSAEGADDVEAQIALILDRLA